MTSPTSQPPPTSAPGTPPRSSPASALLLAPLALGLALSLAACRPPEPPPAEPASLGHPERRGLSLLAVPLTSLLPEPVDPRRSLAVTDQAIASRFSFQEVMERLAAQSDIPGLTALQLYREWWDSQRPAPGLGLGGPHCDDLKNASGQAVLNDFPYTCPRAEGAQADENPFDSPATNPAAYVPLGVFNRFDLAATNGSDCGEYRLLFARRSGIANANARNFIMFEAVLPNPQPELGLEGCRPLVQFWADLTHEPDVTARGDALRRLYFDGLPGFPPVLHLDNFGNATTRATGQVRTNQFMQSTWTLREFRLRKRCTASACTLRFEPDTVKTNPAGLLFSPTATHPLKAEFQTTAFPAQVASLAVADLFRFGMNLDNRFNGGQSNSIGTDNSYVFQLGSAASPLKTTLQQQLTALGSTLTPTQVVARAQALSCAGCHQLSTRTDLGDGLTWPFKSNTFGFIHVSERTLEAGPDGPRYAVSEAMTTTLLPHREELMEAFLGQRPPFCLGADEPPPVDNTLPECKLPTSSDPSNAVRVTPSE